MRYTIRYWQCACILLLLQNSLISVSGGEKINGEPHSSGIETVLVTHHGGKALYHKRSFGSIDGKEFGGAYGEVDKMQADRIGDGQFGASGGFGGMEKKSGTSDQSSSGKRQFDSIDSTFGGMGKKSFDSISSSEFGGMGKKSFDSIDGSSFGGMGKKSFDSIDGSSFGGMGKKSFDSIDGSSFGGMGKKSFDSIDGSSFGGMGKKSFDSIDDSSFGGMGKKSFDSISSSEFGGMGKKSFDSIDGSSFGGMGKRAFDKLDGSTFGSMGKKTMDSTKERHRLRRGFDRIASGSGYDGYSGSNTNMPNKPEGNFHALYRRHLSDLMKRRLRNSMTRIDARVAE